MSMITRLSLTKRTCGDQSDGALQAGTEFVAKAVTIFALVA
jgi:hypothetical protein